MDFDLIGIDLDGTLLDASGKVSDRNLEAIRAAQDAGVMVVPCTGRGWRESRRQLEHVPGLGLGVFVTGAIIAEVASGRTVHHHGMEPDIVVELIDLLRTQPHAVLVYREPQRVGHEYLVTGDGELTPNSHWWFEHTEALVHHHRTPTLKELNDCLRVGLVAPDRDMEILDRLIHERFGKGLEYHNFAAVQMPDDAGMLHILEIFAPGVTKWLGLEWVAQHHGISTQRIAVIGDEINDVPALAAAGCGIAMANAAEPAKSAARFVTHSNNDHGVAHAIEQMLEGHWKAQAGSTV